MPTRTERQRRRSQRMYVHPRRKRPRRRPQPARPRLRFTPTAWARLLHLRDRGPTEVGAFGITPADDLLLVEELAVVRQTCTEVTVAFDDEAVADFFEEQVDQGRRPEQFARIWIHTHPGDSAAPSYVDEETFARVFGRCDWSVMFILAREGDVHAELFWRTGGAARIGLDVEIDYARPFGGAEVATWEAEYTACVQPESHWLPGAGEEADAWDLFPLDAQHADEATTGSIPEPDDTPFLMESL